MKPRGPRLGQLPPSPSPYPAEQQAEAVRLPTSVNHSTPSFNYSLTSHAKLRCSLPCLASSCLAKTVPGEGRDPCKAEQPQMPPHFAAPVDLPRPDKVRMDSFVGPAKGPPFRRHVNGSLDMVFSERCISVRCLKADTNKYGTGSLQLCDAGNFCRHRPRT